MSKIHPTAIVDTQAQLADDVSVGPYSIIGPNVCLGKGTVVMSHTVITGHTIIGAYNHIFHHVVIGEISQDKKYKGEPARLTIGDHNVIREFCTINSGSIENDQYTRLGNDNILLNYSHVGHNSQLQNHIVLANSVQIAGHVEIADWATVGANCGIHQFCHIGTQTMIAAYTVVLQDVPPFVTISGHPARVYGINKIGLKRRAFTDERMSNIQQLFRLLYRKNLSKQAIEEKLSTQQDKDSRILYNFLLHSTRGLSRFSRSSPDSNDKTNTDHSQQEAS